MGCSAAKVKPDINGKLAAQSRSVIRDMNSSFFVMRTPARIRSPAAGEERQGGKNDNRPRAAHPQR
jgi:hypothetical protein